MKYRARCTYCISQMMNIYPNRRKNRMPKDERHQYIEVDTEKEYNLIDKIDNHMRLALIYLQDLEEYIETEKL